MPTDRDLDRSLTNNGYSAHKNGTYSNGSTTVHTDGSHWKKEGGNWNSHKNGRSAG